ncbi:MAG: hypothetical protein N3E37_00320 [Candidatus Micrarchaeota archaeon]|nr:hypothetical protein [Candidatus Micrarchaeota archaeon]
MAAPVSMKELYEHAKQTYKKQDNFITTSMIVTILIFVIVKYVLFPSIAQGNFADANGLVFLLALITGIFGMFLFNNAVKECYFLVKSRVGDLPKSFKPSIIEDKYTFRTTFFSVFTGMLTAIFSALPAYSLVYGLDVLILFVVYNYIIRILYFYYYRAGYESVIEYYYHVMRSTRSKISSKS